MNNTKHLKWTLTVTVSVDPSWVADGFDMGERTEELAALVEGMIPYAYAGEIKATAKVTKGPKVSEIRTLQGYEDTTA